MHTFSSGGIWLEPIFYFWRLCEICGEQCVMLFTPPKKCNSHVSESRFPPSVCAFLLGLLSTPTPSVRPPQYTPSYYGRFWFPARRISFWEPSRGCHYYQSSTAPTEVPTEAASLAVRTTTNGLASMTSSATAAIALKTSAASVLLPFPFDPISLILGWPFLGSLPNNGAGFSMLLLTFFSHLAILVPAFPHRTTSHLRETAAI